MSDLHKVLDVDRGHIRRSYAADCRRCFRQGLRIDIISYIGAGSTELREDARQKVREFNDYLARQLPEFVGSPYLPLPLWISDYRTNNNGKLSLIQQYYDESCPVVGIVDDSPDVCYECESGNIRAYRIFGGRKPWQRHEAGMPVYATFSRAVDDMLEDWKAGGIPYKPQPRGGSDGMRLKKGVWQLQGR